MVRSWPLAISLLVWSQDPRFYKPKFKGNKCFHIPCGCFHIKLTAFLAAKYLGEGGLGGGAGVLSDIVVWSPSLGFLQPHCSFSQTIFGLIFLKRSYPMGLETVWKDHTTSATSPSAPLPALHQWNVLLFHRITDSWDTAIALAHYSHIPTIDSKKNLRKSCCCWWWWGWWGNGTWEGKAWGKPMWKLHGCCKYCCIELHWCIFAFHQYKAKLLSDSVYKLAFKTALDSSHQFVLTSYSGCFFKEILLWFNIQTVLGFGVFLEPTMQYCSLISRFLEFPGFPRIFPS